MRIPVVAVVPLLMVSVCAFAAAKPHTVVLGTAKRVAFVAADANRDEAASESASLKVRPLVVDGAVREWTVGDAHEITTRSFAVQRAMHVNDALPGEKTGRWVWEPGPWLLVDRVTGHVTALHLPGFDSEVSEVAWYRDYAAYCGVKTGVRGGLTAEVGQIGRTRAVVEKVIAKWPQEARVRPVCARAEWQREPMRVRMQMTGGEAQSFAIVGSGTSLVEENEADE